MLELIRIFYKDCIGAFGTKGTDEREFEPFLIGDFPMLGNDIEFAGKFFEEGLPKRGV